MRGRVNVLSVIHGDDVRSGVFADAIEAAGHAVDEWSLAWGTPPPRPLDEYAAVLVLGGSMNTHEEARHPWLRDEDALLRRLLARRVPVLGVCLGAQLLAKAADAPVGPAPEPEIGWHDVELTAAAAADPLLGALPRRFGAFQWHSYTYGVPSGGVELARSRVCGQAFRLGERAWGIQFHAEVTSSQVESWVAAAAGGKRVPAGLLGETATRIEAWNELGRGLCRRFVAVAGRAGAPV
jgi:GMP synthase-like glutamine amidotransferase